MNSKKPAKSDILIPEAVAASSDTPVTAGGKPVVDLTEGNIPLTLAKLSWPVVISSSMNMLGPTIDVMWVGKLGEAAVAGVGVAGIVVQMLMASMMGLVTGMRALIARAFGAKDYETANRVVKQSLMVSILVAVTMATLGIIFAETILKTLGLADEVVQDGAAYLRIVFASSIVMMLRFMMEGSLQASGDTLRPMYITITYRVIHIILCPFLVLGIGFFPRMGVVGAAVTNLIAQTIGLILTTRLLVSGRTHLRIEIKHFHFDWPLIWRIVKIGIPSSVMGIQMGLGAFVLIRFLTPFGTTAVAAHTIWARVDMFLMMPMMGIGMAAGVLAGHNLGANRPERAVKSGWYAVLLGEALMVFWVIIIFFFAEWIVKLFNSDPPLVETGAQFLRIASIGYLVASLPAVFQNTIAGAGDTLPPMVLAVISTWILQIPLAYYFTKFTSSEVYGLRWAIVISTFISAIFFLVYFIMGKWKYKRV